MTWCYWYTTKIFEYLLHKPKQKFKKSLFKTKCHKTLTGFSKFRNESMTNQYEKNNYNTNCISKKIEKRKKKSNKKTFTMSINGSFFFI